MTAVISVQELKTNTAANIVVDAIAFARVGRDDPLVVVKRKSRRIVVQEYEHSRVTPRNVEAAIACVGYKANDVPARFGESDSIPDNWIPIGSKSPAPAMVRTKI